MIAEKEVTELMCKEWLKLLEEIINRIPKDQLAYKAAIEGLEDIRKDDPINIGKVVGLYGGLAIVAAHIGSGLVLGFGEKCIDVYSGVIDDTDILNDLSEMFENQADENGEEKENG